LAFFTVIIATLNRPTLRDTLNSLRRQTFRDFEVITWTGGVNEYEARNLAAEKAKGEVLAFIDDDAYAHREWLKNAYRYLQNPEVYVLTGPVEGDCFGWGVWLRLSHKYWSIGTNMFVRKWVFREVGGFEVDWGLKPPPKGWRSDSVGKDTPILIRQKDGVKFYTVSEYSQRLNFHRLEDGKEYAVSEDMILCFTNNHVEWRPIALVVRHKVEKAYRVRIAGFSEIIVTADHSLIKPIFETDSNARIRHFSLGDFDVLINGKIQKSPYLIKGNKWRIAGLQCVKPVVGERVFISATEYEMPEMKYVPFKLTDLIQYDTPLNHYAARFDGIEEVAKKIPWRRRSSMWQWQKKHALPIHVLRDLKVDVEKCEIICKGNHKSLKYEYPIPLTDDLIKFFGLWIADGSYHINGVSISCREAGSLVSSVSSLFNARYSVGKNGVDYKIYSRFLRRVMEILGFQGDAYTKRVPSFIFNMSKRQRKIFLEGYFMGDGTRNNSAVTVNRRLAEEMQALLSSVGVVSSITKHTSTTPYSSQPKTFFKIRKISENAHGGIIAIPTSTGRIYLGKITSVEEIEYNDYVYDFHVPDVSNFFAITLLMHNTDLTWRILDRYGEEHYVHAEDVLVYHPERMQSVWEPRVEEKFYLRHRDRCLKIFAPVDPRLCSFVVSRGLEKDEEVVKKLVEMWRGKISL
jgi:intein/homing endonuclease